MTKQSDSPWTDMGKSLQEEIDGDAPKLAKDLFGEKWPGTSTTTDVQAGKMISEAYRRGDRAFLQHLATQGPQQFLRVWKSLGGTIPDKSGTPGGAEGLGMQQAQQGLNTNA